MQLSKKEAKRSQVFVTNSFSVNTESCSSLPRGTGRVGRRMGLWFWPVRCYGKVTLSFCETLRIILRLKKSPRRSMNVFIALIFFNRYYLVLCVIHGGKAHRRGGVREQLSRFWPGEGRGPGTGCRWGSSSRLGVGCCRGSPQHTLLPGSRVPVTVVVAAKVWVYSGLPGGS